MTRNIIISLILLQNFLFAQAQTKIIDMHIHSYSQSDFGVREPARDSYGKKGAASAEVHRAETFTAFKKWNIVKAMVSGNPESVEEWARKDSYNRVIRGILIFSPNDYGLDSVKFEQMIKDKKIEVFGEIGAYYGGTTLSDSMWQPYLRICERYDIPQSSNLGNLIAGCKYHIEAYLAGEA